MAAEQRKQTCADGDHELIDITPHQSPQHVKEFICRHCSANITTIGGIQRSPFISMTRRETGLIEFVCAHGVGHPARSSAEFMDKTYKHAAGTWSVHGCCGCCEKYPMPDIGFKVVVYRSDTGEELVLRHVKPKCNDDDESPGHIHDWVDTTVDCHAQKSFTCKGCGDHKIEDCHH